MQAGLPKPLAILKAPIDRFFESDSAAGILLMVAATTAMIWANLPGLSEYYFALWNIPVSVGLSEAKLNKPLILWINDGLMAIFFFVVGLEIKREILAGKLSSMRKASLPMIAAIGGMVVPASIFFALNPSGPGQSGWGIPMATDIAFALGIMALLGPRVPVALKIFLTALAIVDDIGAVLVIAVFYSSDISLWNLAIGAVFLSLMVGASALGVRNPFIYGLLGIGGVWLSFLLSGVHATVAGVLAAFAIPARVRIDQKEFQTVLHAAVDRFVGSSSSEPRMLSHEQQSTIDTIEGACENVQAPLQRLEHRMYPLVMYFVMPVFALANAGVAIDTNALSAALGSVGLGIFLGLLLGKLIGVTGFTWLAIRLGLSDLPEGSRWSQVVGVALLAGVGFTMSLFIGNLAFDDPKLVDAAKIAIFAASLVAGLLGFLVLFRTGNKSPA